MDRFQCKLGFIGTGNMARALIRGILESQLYEASQIVASDKDKGILDDACSQFGIRAVYSNAEVVKNAGAILFCVKPQNMKEVLLEVRDDLESSHLIISIAAGISIKTILDTIGKDIPIIRVMPNTPALVQKGMSGIACGPGSKKEHVDIALDIFGSIGEAVIVEEPMLDVVTAVSGSGPGYVFRIMECMVESAVELGLEEELARRLVIQTFVGASHLAKESGEALSTLRKMVTSPKGTTEAGLFVFEKTGLRDIIHDVIKAAYNRSIQIKKEWEK